MTNYPPPLIRLSRVSKHFGSFEAVSDISLDIAAGESVGIVGPNGAGKTTLIRMLCALLPVSSGTIEYCGKNIAYSETRGMRKRGENSNLLAFRRDIGFVPQSTTVDDKLTARENMELQAQLYHLNPTKSGEEITHFLEFVGLGEHAFRPVQFFSGGMKRRLELARALFPHPRILIMDEPTLGLDPIAKHELWDFLRKLQATEKITLLITTNAMEEAEQLCDRVVIINFGQIVVDGTPQELKERLPGGIVVIRTDISQANNLNQLFNQWQKGGFPGSSFQLLNFEQVIPGNFKCAVSSADDALKILIPAIQLHNIKIQALQCQSPSLDDVFVHFTRHIQGIPFDQYQTMLKILESLNLKPQGGEGLRNESAS